MSLESCKGYSIRSPYSDILQYSQRLQNPLVADYMRDHHEDSASYHGAPCLHLFRGSPWVSGAGSLGLGLGCYRAIQGIYEGIIRGLEDLQGFYPKPLNPNPLNRGSAYIVLILPSGTQALLTQTRFPSSRVLEFRV